MSRRIGAKLKALGVDVLYTRTTDTLIALSDRGRIANEAEGDLFISIHVNAANPNWKSPGGARGFETYFLAEAPLMANIGKTLGVVLGPRGKMPRPLPPGADPSPQINNLRNTVKVRSKDKPVFHCVVGSETMPVEDIADNVEAVLKRVEAKLEHGRMNVASVYVKTTMGPSVRLV